ncbi:MAG: dienelactone hydrolase family protein [Acidobacteria bacterium]|nr:dienelactone hydrolase family protein [Acidobacteriota bacterium]
MRTICCLFFASAALPAGQCLAESGSTPFLARTYRTAAGQAMPYRLFVPRNYDRRREYPLAVWLHGSGGRGSDNRMQISEDNQTGSHIWTKPENQARYPCFVLVPQGDSWHQPDSWEPSPELELVVKIIDSLEKEYNIDRGRVYLAGQSMGGIGTWAMIIAYPKMFAAAVPICGGGDPSRASVIVDVPIWAFHGDQDRSVSVEQSRNIVAAIRQAGGKPRYSEYKGADHDIWNRVFREPELMPWVFSQRLASGKK